MRRGFGGPGRGPWRGGFGPGPWRGPWRGGFGPGPGPYGPGFRRRWWGGPRYYRGGNGCCCLFTLMSFATLGVLMLGGLTGIYHLKKSGTRTLDDNSK
jgi:hypothetical protein